MLAYEVFGFCPGLRRGQQPPGCGSASKVGPAVSEATICFLKVWVRGGAIGADLDPDYLKLQRRFNSLAKFYRGPTFGTDPHFWTPPSQNQLDCDFATEMVNTTCRVYPDIWPVRATSVSQHKPPNGLTLFDYATYDVA